MSRVNYTLEVSGQLFRIFKFNLYTREVRVSVVDYIVTDEYDNIDTIRDFIESEYLEIVGNETNRDFQTSVNQDRLKWKIVWKDTDTLLKVETGYSIGFGYEGFKDQLDYFIDILVDLFAKYENKLWEGHISLIANYPLGNVVYGGDLHSKFMSGHEKYYIIDYPSIKNCLFKAFWINHLINSGQMKDLRTYNPIVVTSQFKKKILAKNPELSTPEISEDSVKIFQKHFYDLKTHYQNYRVIILDPQFNVIENYDPYNIKVKEVTIIFRVIQNHIQVIIPKSKVPKEKEEEYSKFSKHFKPVEKISNSQIYVDSYKNYYYQGKTFSHIEYLKLLYSNDLEDKIPINDLKQIKIEKEEKGCEIEKLTEIFTFDIETITHTDFKQYAFLSGLVFENGSNIQYISWNGNDNVKSFFLYLSTHINYFGGKTCFAHNGAKFDYFIILKEYLLRNDNIFILKPRMIFIDGGLVSFTIVHIETKKEIVFKDSCRLLPGSLNALCNSFKPPVPKDGEFNIEEAVKDWKKNIHEIVKYHEKDCLSLYYILKKFQEIIYNTTSNINENPGVDALDCLTTSQLSMRIFLSKFYHIPVYKPPLLMDILIRKFFFGGMVECQMIGKFDVKKMNDYAKEKKLPELFLNMKDFNSLYPSVMVEYLPTGKYNLLNRSELIQNGMIGEKDDGYDILLDVHGYVLCEIHVEEKDYDFFNEYGCLHGMHNGYNLIFGIPDKKKLTLIYSREIHFAQDNGIPYNYKILGLIQYDAKPLLKNFVEIFYNLKQKANVDGDEALATVIKLILNGNYGKWAIKLIRDLVKITRNKNFYETLNSWQKGDLIDFNEVGEYNITKERKITSPKVSNIAIGAAITSLARLKLYQAKLDLMGGLKNSKKIGKVIMYDTDSLVYFITIPMEEFVESNFYKKYIIGGKEELLGKMKDEMSIKKTKKEFGKHFNSFLEERKLKEEWDMVPIDKAYIAGCKMYGLETVHKVIEDNKEKNLIKNKLALKGRSKKGNPITMETIARVIDSQEENYQTEFKSGMPSIFNYDDPFYVKIIPKDYTERKPKVFKSVYFKGDLVEDEYYGQKIKRVLPLKLSEIEDKSKKIDILNIFEILKKSK